MTPEQFCYWLNGFGQLTTDAPNPEQWKAIKEHLETVFTKVTPSSPGYLGNDLGRLGQIAPLTPAPPSPPSDWPRSGLATFTC